MNPNAKKILKFNGFGKAKQKPISDNNNGIDQKQNKTGKHLPDTNSQPVDEKKKSKKKGKGKKLSGKYPFVPGALSSILGKTKSSKKGNRKTKD